MQPEAAGVRDDSRFQAPNLSLPPGLSRDQMQGGLGLLDRVQNHRFEGEAAAAQFERNRERVISLLSDARVRQAFDVTNSEQRLQEKYGRNAFGWSPLMARRLIDLGVSFVQVNL